jgi:hypothetical protein
MATKLGMMGYLGTYFAIACSMPLSIINYFVVGWLNGDLILAYMPSWSVMLAVIVVFNGANVLAYSWFRQRVGEKNFVRALLENLKWMPFFLVFFNGISLHVLRSIGCHLLGIPVEWSSTEKEIGEQGLVRYVLRYFCEPD